MIKNLINLTGIFIGINFQAILLFSLIFGILYYILESFLLTNGVLDFTLSDFYVYVLSHDASAQISILKNNFLYLVFDFLVFTVIASIFLTLILRISNYALKAIFWLENKNKGTPEEMFRNSELLYKKRLKARVIRLFIIESFKPPFIKKTLTIHLRIWLILTIYLLLTLIASIPFYWFFAFTSSQALIPNILVSLVWLTVEAVILAIFIPSFAIVTEIKTANLLKNFRISFDIFNKLKITLLSFAFGFIALCLAIELSEIILGPITYIFHVLKYFVLIIFSLFVMMRVQFALLNTNPYNFVEYQFADDAKILEEIAKRLRKKQEQAASSQATE